MIQFTLGPFTNPSTSDPVYFTWTSFAMIQGGSYQIDKFSSLFIKAELGSCKIENFSPVDSNNYIYGIASNWTVAMSCTHQIQ
jgi:hypothetical protein